MKPVAWLYLKMFLIFGPGFGLLMTLIDQVSGVDFQLNQFLFRIIFFGGIMSLLLVSMHIASLRGKGVKKFTPDNLNVIQKRSIQSALSKNELVEKIARDHILAAMTIKVTEQGINLKSGMSLTSSGDLVSIQVEHDNGPVYHYEIVSKPILKSTLLDYGTNFGYVSRLEKIMMDAA